MHISRNKFYVSGISDSKTRNRLIVRLQDNSHTRSMTVDSKGDDGSVKIFIVSTWSFEELQQWLSKSKVLNVFNAEMCNEQREV